MKEEVAAWSARMSCARGCRCQHREKLEEADSYDVNCASQYGNLGIKRCSRASARPVHFGIQEMSQSIPHKTTQTTEVWRADGCSAWEGARWRVLWQEPSRASCFGYHSSVSILLNFTSVYSYSLKHLSKILLLSLLKSDWLYFNFIFLMNLSGSFILILVYSSLMLKLPQSVLEANESQKEEIFMQ